MTASATAAVTAPPALESFAADFADLEATLPGADRPAIRRLRRAAWERFAAAGLPTPRLEDWKKTNVGPLGRISFHPAPAEDGRDDPARRDAIRGLLPPGDVPCLVFVNGRYSERLSRVGSPPQGVVAGSLAALLATAPEAVERALALHAGTDDPAQAFTALNTALFADGGCVLVADRTVVTTPIHVVYVAAPNGAPAASHPRTLVVAGDGAQATVVETYVALGEGVYFTNAVSEIVLGANASVDHVRVQREADAAFHVGTVASAQGRDSRFASHVVSLGAGLARVDIYAALAEPGADCRLTGLYVAAGQQHVDHHTTIDHATPHGSSREVYHGVLGGRAHAVFNGKIVVRADAQKTDAHQVNKNLLLSDDAMIDTKPQLEIFANDVKCKHGATVGQLSEDALFYLRARGIDAATAQRLLLHAFAGVVLDGIPVPDVRAAADALVTARFARAVAPEAA